MIPVRPATQPGVLDRLDLGPPDITPSEIQYHKPLAGDGKGCYGQVYTGDVRGITVAIKRLFKQDLKPQTLLDFKKEVEICSRLNHPNIVLFMGACTEPGNMAIVTELCERGNLETLLHNDRAQLSLFRRMVMAKEIAVGMAWLHGMEPMILHRDLKPSNILLDKHGHIKLCDFGLSAIKPGHQKLKDKDSIPGTPLWMAPEVMLGRQIDEKSDVYSFAIVLWEIVTQKVPWPEMTSFPKFRQAVCLNDERPPIPEDTLPAIKDLLNICWHKDPAVRPSFQEISKMIEQLLPATIITDPEGIKFWQDRYLSREWVPFDEFLSAFCTDFGLERPINIPLECFKALAESKYTDGIMETISIVKIETFSALLANFGPIKLTRKTKEVTIFDRIESICSQQWYHGDITKEQAEKRLAVHESGYFLVRISTTVAGSFTVSRVTSDLRIQHHRIDWSSTTATGKASCRVNNQTYVVQKKSLRSIVKSLRGYLNLTNVCPGSQYRPIFKKCIAKVLDCEGGYKDDDLDWMDEPEQQ